jgi:hypothetical protein
VDGELSGSGDTEGIVGDVGVDMDVVQRRVGAAAVVGARGLKQTRSGTRAIGVPPLQISALGAESAITQPVYV